MTVLYFVMEKKWESITAFTAFTVDLTDNVLYGQDNLLCVL